MKLLEQLHVVATRRRLAPNTIQAYDHWIRRFLRFSARLTGDWKHPAQLGTADVEAFLNDLVLNLRLSASAQNQALCALVFLYTHVLDGVIPQDHLGKFLLQRSRRSKRIPTVLSRDEVRRVIDAIDHVMNKPSIAVTSPLDHLADSPARPSPTLTPTPHPEPPEKNPLFICKLVKCSI